jgi:predicted Rossmann fold flavoprotein
VDRFDIVVIGAGPAGLFSAITAAGAAGKKKLSIIIVDANMKAGRKLAVTGNGRCNLTNSDVSASNYHGNNPLFVNGILGNFDNSDLMEWFTSRGVEFKTEENGRIFPVTDQALTVIDRLLEEIETLGIKLSLNTKVTSLKKKPDGQYIIEVNGKDTIEAEKVILATGGLTYPRLGSSGDGYNFAGTFGHKIIPPLPCLTGFETLEKTLFDLQGVQLMAEVTCKSGTQAIPEISDEVMFTHYGVTGPAMFTLSSFIVRELVTHPVSVILNFFPGLSREETEQKIRDIWAAGPQRVLGNSLTGVLPKKFVHVLLRNIVKTGLDIPVSNISKDLRNSIVKAFTGLELHLKSARSWEDAQVTSGGISTDEIDPRSLESKLCPGLFFAGEVLDIDGECGGYNLQFAFSSGYMAGLAAARDYD